uniref:Uncharacterized protein n=1 Tax=Zea mays TaxID=4577 RepID=A0A804Q5B2_MAIZE
MLGLRRSSEHAMQGIRGCCFGSAPLRSEVGRQDCEQGLLAAAQGKKKEGEASRAAARPWERGGAGGGVEQRRCAGRAQGFVAMDREVRRGAMDDGEEDVAGEWELLLHAMDREGARLLLIQARRATAGSREVGDHHGWALGGSWALGCWAEEGGWECGGAMGEGAQLQGKKTRAREKLLPAGGG